MRRYGNAMISFVLVETDRSHLPSQRVVKCEEADGDGDTDATGSALDFEPISILSDLLHLHDDIPGPRGRERKLVATGNVVALLSLDFSLVLIHKCGYAFGRWMQLVFFLEFGANIISQIGFSGQRSQLQRRGCVKNIPVRDSGEDARDTFLVVNLFKVNILGTSPDSFKTKGLDGTSAGGVNLAVRLQKIGDDVAPSLRLSLEEVEEIAADILVERNAILAAEV